MRKYYPSDISREQFEQVRLLPDSFPKWRTTTVHYSYWAIWSEPDAEGVSLLERALKNPLARFIPDRGATLVARS
jgi:hypothetical protein